MVIIFQDGAPTLRGWQPQEDFTVSLLPKTISSGAHSAILDTVDDITYNAETNMEVMVCNDCIVENGLENPPVLLEVQTPDVCEVSANGVVTPLGEGACVVQATGQTGERSIVSTQYLAQTGATVYNSIDSFVVGSLRRYLYDQQIAALAGVTPGAAAQRAGVNAPAGMSDSGGGANPANFLMAPTAAATTAGFTALPTDLLAEILDGAAGSARWRVWITPHHYITWDRHLPAIRPPTATRIDVSRETAVYYSATEWTGALAKLLPYNPTAYLPHGQNSVDQGISCWARLFNTYDGTERRWVQPVYKGFNKTENFNEGDTRIPFRKRASNDSLANGGDSGSPVFCGINGTLVILGVTSTQYNIGGTCYFEHDYVSLIQAAVDALDASGPYTVGVIDLSGFTDYS